MKNKLSVNEGGLDRVLRAMLGIALFFSGLITTQVIFQILFFFFAGMMFFTAITGFCGFYKLLGINTCKIKKQKVAKK